MSLQGLKQTSVQITSKPTNSKGASLYRKVCSSLHLSVCEMILFVDGYSSPLECKFQEIGIGLYFTIFLALTQSRYLIVICKMKELNECLYIDMPSFICYQVI